MKKMLVFFLILLLTGCAPETNEFTVTFETNGGSLISSVTIKEDSTVEEPVNPEKDDYYFVGWYSDIELETEYLFSDGVKKDFTLYAKWEMEYNTIIVKDYDQTVLHQLEYQEGDDISSIVIDSPTREGYTFTSWDNTLPNTMPNTDIVLVAQYTINSYSLSYKDYDGSTIYTESYEYNSDLSGLSIDNPERIGYSFSAWDTPLPNTMPNNDLVLTAEYTVNTYSITFKDYDDTNLYTTTIDYGSDLTSLSVTTPLREGYNFSAWDASLPNTMPNNDLILTALYTPNTYSIIFKDYSNSVFQTIEVQYNEDLSNISVNTPVREEHVFIGWDDTLPETMPANDLELEALWQVNQYKITYVDQNKEYMGEEMMDYNNVISNQTLTAPEVIGRTFNGITSYLPDNMPNHDIEINTSYIFDLYTLLIWNMDGSQYYYNIFYYNDDLSGIVLETPVIEGYIFEGWDYPLPETMPANELIIKAEYEYEVFTIYLHKAYEIEEILVAYKTDLSTLDISDPEWEGYTFNYWSAELPDKMPLNDIHLYANYTANEYYLRYAYDEVSSWYYRDFDYNSDLRGVSVSDPIKEGYDFIGWDSLRPDTMPNHNITIYPIYIPHIYSIEYRDWDGSVLYSFDVEFASDLSTISVSDAQRNGYVFDGWDYVLPTNMPSNDIVINADYQYDTFTITYHIDEGINADNPTTYQIYTSTIVLEDPQKDGHTFEGFYDNEFFSNSIVDEITTGSYGDIDLYAKFEIITYDITYDLDGGTNESNPDSYHIETDTIILEVPTKTGHSFIGFYDNDSYTGSPVSEITIGSQGDIDLYAKWQVDSYEIEYVMYDDYDPLTDILLNPNESIEHVALGTSHSALVTSEGRVFTWGFNAIYGQLGTGDNTNSSIPVEITSQFGFYPLEVAIDISLGENFSALITSEGRVFTWGEAYDGQLGNGGTTASNIPLDITSQFAFNTLEKPIMISLGTDHAGLVTSDGRLFMWGYNHQGQLGNNTITKSNVPIDITSYFGLNTNETITDFVTSKDFNIAVTSDLRVFTWGNNSYGQLGTGNITQYKSPTDITANFNFASGISLVDIDTGNSHSSLVTSNGVIYMWGYNNFGQLGDDTTVLKNTPTAINSQFTYLLNFNEKIIDVELGEAYTIALTSEGKVFSWGIGSEGETGYGGFYNRKVPQDITNNFDLHGNDKISFIAAGVNHTMAVDDHSHLHYFGDNNEGKLGNGETTDIATPSLGKFKALYGNDLFQYDYGVTLTKYNPARTGYSILEWYTDSDMTIQYTFTTMPDEDITLYGRWVVEE